MKKGPIIQDFKVPESVFVNMQNDNDYIKIPLENLDNEELEELCLNFVRGVAKQAGRVTGDLSISINDTTSKGGPE